MRRHSIIWQLLRHNISRGQLIGYAFANFVGLAIVLVAMQFYADVSKAWSGGGEGGSSGGGGDYLIISKHVEGDGLFGINTTPLTFSDAEIQYINSQPWRSSMGSFEAARFGVYASVEMAGRRMSTALFLEAIPDQFIDIMPDEWSWQPPESINGGEVPPIPIIISKDYLALYNFGFAASRGLPQLSEALVSSIPITLSISGNGRQMKLRAFIVGFSSRLNTIAVPTQFIDWGNEHFADTPPENPSRLILETNSPGDPKIQQFLDDNDYECAGDKTNNGRAAHFLAIITSVVAAVGLVICLLAFFILLLSISLLLQKNRQKNHALMMLGYSPQYVTRYYLRLVVTVNACSLICSIIALIAAQMIWKAPLLNIGISVTPTAPTILVGFIIMVLITIINFIAVSRNVRKAFPRPSTTKAK